MQPPASAERLVGVEERLRTKLRASARAVGVIGTILPRLAFGYEGSLPASPPESREQLASAAAHWRDGTVQPPTAPIVAAVRARIGGLLAVVEDGVGVRIVGASGTDIGDDAELVLRVLAQADGADIDVETACCDRAVAALRRWLDTVAEHREITMDGALRARARRSVVDRIAAIARRTPRHRRAAISPLVSRARLTVGARYGAGAEHVLGELASADMSDEAWLRAIGTFGAIHTGEDTPLAGRSGCPRIRALLLLVAPGRAET
jgi:hypothetical protein